MQYDYDRATKILGVTSEDLEQAKFDVDHNGHIIVRTQGQGDYHTNALLTLQFYAAKGLSLTEVENEFNIDFVVTENCSPVIKEGKLVIIERTV